jgi:hypothetical protein
MASTKISQLPSLSTMSDSAIIPVVDSGVTKTITGLVLKAYPMTTAANIAGGAANQIPYQTGSGATTFGSGLTYNGTTFTATNISGNLSSATADGTNGVGYINIPQNSQSAAYTTVLSDAGKHIYHPASDANARTYTIAANASVAYPIGTVIAFVNMTSQAVTIAINSDTMYLGNLGTTGSRTLGQYGVANALKIASTTWIITGTALT